MLLWRLGRHILGNVVGLPVLSLFQIWGQEFKKNAVFLSVHSAAFLEQTQNRQLEG